MQHCRVFNTADPVEKACLRCATKHYIAAEYLETVPGHRSPAEYDLEAPCRGRVLFPLLLHQSQPNRAREPMVFANSISGGDGVTMRMFVLAVAVRFLLK